MSITQTLAELTTNVRRTTDTLGTSAAARHPDANIYDAVNRGIAALHRKLTQTIPDQRSLSSYSGSLTAGTSTVALSTISSSFERLISIELTANGSKHHLTRYQMQERPGLLSPTGQRAQPQHYRIIGSNLEFLPTPDSAYTILVWYVPDASQLTAGGSIDTIARLDDFIIWYASREIATRDSKWQLIATLDQRLREISADIETYGRNRDMQEPPSIINERAMDRYGRSLWRR